MAGDAFAPRGEALLMKQMKQMSLQEESSGIIAGRVVRNFILGGVDGH
tara:strand:- start:230 stop:373 length:144 start_codon:yes stop_codon:yes gene_type:complete